MKEGTKEFKKKYDKIKVIMLAVVTLFGSGIVLSDYILSGYIKEEGLNYVKEIRKTRDKIVSGDITIRRDGAGGIDYTRLKDFVEMASTFNPTYDNLIEDLSKESFILDDNQKIQLTYQAVYEDIEKVTEVPDKYKDDKDYFESNVYEYSLNLFGYRYEQLFNEEFDASLLEKNLIGGEHPVGCPVIYMIDEELDKVYFSSFCGKTNNRGFETKVYDFYEDENYYYVYEYIAGYYYNNGNKVYYRVHDKEETSVDTFAGNEDLFETLSWKFDKNYNFISTSYVE